MSGMMLCLGLRLTSGRRAFLEARSLSTGDTAMLARRPGDVAADLVPRVCGDDAALLDALRRRDEVLLLNIGLPYSPPTRSLPKGQSNHHLQTDEPEKSQGIFFNYLIKTASRKDATKKFDDSTTVRAD